jgi:malonate decarboxylase alpha subunit
MESIRSWMEGPVLDAKRIIDAQHLLIQPHDRVVIEGDNQKQADFLSLSCQSGSEKAPQPAPDHLLY